MSNSISFNTKFGFISIIEKNSKIIMISFGRLKKTNSSKILENLKIKILNYFSGNKIDNNFLLEINGSNIQKKIWREIQKIPFGSTKSYGQIAKKLNTSSRYVGKVCGQNKHLLFIPCHRVIRSDGQLGGYSGLGGIKLKKNLLNLESKSKKFL